MSGKQPGFLPRQGTESARCRIFRSDAVVFSVGFRWSVGRLKGRLDERRSVALPPFVSTVINNAALLRRVRIQKKIERGEVEIGDHNSHFRNKFINLWTQLLYLCIFKAREFHSTVLITNGEKKSTTNEVVLLSVKLFPSMQDLWKNKLIWVFWVCFCTGAA